MGIVVDVRSNASAVIMEMKAMASDMAEKATVRALNKTMEQVRTAASREVRAAGYNLKAADIKKAMKMHRAKTGQLWARLTASGKPLPLIQYGARAVKSGISVKVLNGRKVIKGGFIATMPSGHQGLFVHGAGGKNRWVKVNGKRRRTRLPIQELYGPSVPASLVNAKVQEALVKLMNEKFPQILAHESKFIREGGRRR